MYGTNKNINSPLIKFTFNSQNNVDIIRIKINDTEVLIAPLYIRGAEWYSDFNVVEHFFAENNPYECGGYW